MSEKELTDNEIQRLRRILSEDEKWEWLKAGARKLAALIFGTAAALVAFRDDVSQLFSWLLGRGS